MEEITKKQAYRFSIRLLSKKEYSIIKLKQKLEQKKFPKEEIEETIKILVQKKYLSDERYIDGRIKGLLKKGQSPQLIHYKICQETKKTENEIPMAKIEAIMEESLMTLDLQIETILKKKLNSLKNLALEKGSELDPKRRNKAIRFLLSKGYNLNDIFNSLKKFDATQDI